MPINTILLFVCGVLLGLLLKKNGAREQNTRTVSQAGAGVVSQAGAGVASSPFQGSAFRAPVSSSPMGGLPIMREDDDFSPQLANLQMALGKTRAPGKAYSAARAAGILR